MTTVSVNLSDEEAEVLAAKAASEDLTLEAWFQKVAAREARTLPSIAHLQGTEEWAREFDAWVDSHDPNTPVLSDEAMSRDSIYPDRG